MRRPVHITPIAITIAIAVTLPAALLAPTPATAGTATTNITVTADTAATDTTVTAGTAATVTTVTRVAGPAELTVVYRADSTVEPVTWTLRCPARTGTHPAVTAACDLLETATVNLFAPTPPTVGCLTIWGGPQTATVVGRWRNWWVNASFSRTNSCEMYRWFQLDPVLPKP